MRKNLAACALAAALAAAALVAGPAAADAADEPGSPTGGEAVQVFPYEVHQTTLDNGLKVVTIPFDSPGTVAYFVVVRAGSRQEVEAGHSGFAHFFEHMMFRGTEKYPTDEYNDVLKRMGADSNAFTTDDYTNYHIVGPSSELETMMDIESDRFANLRYSEEAFRTEALAVLGEYNKNASSPFLPMYEKLRDLAFDDHTYKHTTLGFLADIQAMPGYYDYSLSFFDRFYRPENVVLLVVGDVVPTQVDQLAERYWGDWKKGYQPATIPTEPAQQKTESAALDWPTPTRPQLMMGYHVPAFDAAAKETAALDLISQLLFSESAPLYQKLVVDEQSVDFVSGDSDWHRDPYLFMVYTRVKSDDLVAGVRKTIEDAFADLASKPVDAARLDRIKQHLRYQYSLSLDSPSAVAFSVANMLELTGEVAPINRVFKTYQEITPADVQRVAQQVFQPQNETVVTLSHPASADAGAGGSAAAHGSGR